MSTAGDAPLVSVIIPTFNDADFLSQAVQSVIGQETPDSRAELIVIDDGSTDHTREVLQPHLSRLRYVHQENAGHCAARNCGLRLARGTFVLFLDSDDFLLPGALRDLLACFADDPELGAVQGGWRTVDAAGETLCDIEAWHHAPELDLETWIMATPHFLGGLLCRRSWAERGGGFDTGLSQVEDVDFVLKLSMQGCRFKWLRRSVVSYRQHGSSMSRDVLGQARSTEQVFDRIFEHPDLPQHIRDSRDEFYYYRCAWTAWRLYRTGATREVDAYLRRSMDLGRRSPQQTVLHWCKMFVAWSRGVGAGIEEMQGLLPTLRTVAGLDDARWRSVEAALPWWATTWSHYLSDATAPPASAWAEQAPRSACEVLALAQACLLLTPVERTLCAIGRFWDDIRTKPLDPPFRAPDLISLYLTAFGQAAMAGRTDIAKGALSQALRLSRQPAALRAWRRFAANAVRYAISERRQTAGASR